MSDTKSTVRKLVLEVSQKTKARWVATSNRDGMRLHDWIIGTLDDNAWFDDEGAPGNIRQDDD
jgi:hypothetical protein